MLALLFFGAVLQQRRAEHPNAEAVQRRAAVERAHFLAQNFSLVARQSAAAVLTRPLRHCPAAFRHTLEPLSLRLGLESPMPAAPTGIFLSLRRSPHLGRAIRFEPGACFFPKSF